MDSNLFMPDYTIDKDLLEKLKKIKHIALDMDGTIYKGNTLFPFTKGFLETLRENNISYSFLTNNPSKNTEDYLNHLQKMGLQVDEKELYTTAHATIGYLKNHYPDIKKLFILGTPSMIKEFEQAGYYSVPNKADEDVDAVIVGFDLTLSYDRLSRAAWWISQNKLYIATNPDYVCPTDQPLVLVDCGAICAALEKSTGKAPDVVLGKPQPEMIQVIMKKMGLQECEIAMVGDRISTDILMAHRANILGVLVLSGEATMEDAIKADPKPHIVVPDIGVLGRIFQEAHYSIEI